MLRHFIMKSCHMLCTKWSSHQDILNIASQHDQLSRTHCPIATEGFWSPANSILTLTGEDDSSVLRFCGSASTSWRLFFILSRRSPVGLSGDLYNTETLYNQFYGTVFKGIKSVFSLFGYFLLYTERSKPPPKKWS